LAWDKDAKRFVDCHGDAMASWSVDSHHIVAIGEWPYIKWGSRAFALEAYNS